MAGPPANSHDMDTRRAQARQRTQRQHDESTNIYKYQIILYIYIYKITRPYLIIFAYAIFDMEHGEADFQEDSDTFTFHRFKNCTDGDREQDWNPCNNPNKIIRVTVLYILCCINCFLICLVFLRHDSSIPTKSLEPQSCHGFLSAALEVAKSRFGVVKLHESGAGRQVLLDKL